MSPITILNSQPCLLTGSDNKWEDDCACPDGASALSFEGQTTFENDCACPDGKQAIPSFPETQLYSIAQGAYVESLTDQFWLAFSPYVPGGPSVINKIGLERFRDFSTPLPLTAPFDQILARQNLIIPHMQIPISQTTPPETLTTWLHITNACNLDCPYCYVKKSSEYMSEDIGINAIKSVIFTAQKHSFKVVKLKYAGGEATLHFQLIRKLHDVAKKLSKATSIKLIGTILSNGVRLSKSDINWIMENSLNLMISLDGIGILHDQIRPHKNGEGSFKEVSKTIEEATLMGMHPFISITITRHNAVGIAETVKWALDRNLPVSLNFYRQTDANVENMRFEEDAIIQAMLDAYATFEEYLPEQPFINGLLDRVQMGAHQHTCGVGKNYIVIDHRGGINQCQMELTQPTHSSKLFDMLPILEGGKILNLPVDNKEGCASCVFRYRCAGGCPLETYRATGRWDVKSPNCRIYKTLIPAALRLEGKRILKYHESLL